MTIKECYDAMGGDYKMAIARLKSDTLIEKFVKKFPEQSGYETLCGALDEKNYKSAFASAHTIKGLCLNLNFNKLGESISELTELLRNNSFSDKKHESLLLKFKNDYQQTIIAIKSLE